MGEIHHAVHGWLTPAISYFTACLGAYVALRGTRWALLSTGRTKANWLMFASTSLGAGIWSMHFIAMLGFAVSGVQIRYNVLLTIISLVVAIVVVGVGIFIVGYSRNAVGALVAGGVATGLGVAAMHYLGMAAVELPGHVMYNHVTVGASVVIAVLAATAALWAALNIKGTLAVLAAAPVMGVAVCAMHYTGMAAVSVDITESSTPPGGVQALQFIFPLAVGLGCYVFFGSLAFAAAPTTPQSVRPGGLPRTARTGASPADTGRVLADQPIVIGPAPRLVPRQRATAHR
ncbi:MHYT domain-containing protein [Kitasatospora sp. NBC_00315]|uniref:MHYT domain-containing protein n=1 Tax=Kitasatospora sp. NBC_00315 TaxID=2975963 RepID=UPI00324C0A5E